MTSQKPILSPFPYPYILKEHILVIDGYCIKNNEKENSKTSSMHLQVVKMSNVSLDLIFQNITCSHGL